MPTYELRRRGIDVVAKPCLRVNDDFADNHWKEPFENMQWHWNLPGSGEREIERLMRSWGSGARAEVYVAWQGRDSGAHVFIAENDNGVIKYICPQSGNKDSSSFFQSAKHGFTGIARIDNLKPSRWILECCEPV